MWLFQLCWGGPQYSNQWEVSQHEFPILSRGWLRVFLQPPQRVRPRLSWLVIHDTVAG
jgi:hypothetical protein